MKHQGNMASHKNYLFLAIKLKGTEYCNLSDKELKIDVMKKLNRLQENSERQFNKIRNKICEQNDPLLKRKTF